MAGHLQPRTVDGLGSSLNQPRTVVFDLISGYLQTRIIAVVIGSSDSGLL